MSASSAYGIAAPVLAAVVTLVGQYVASVGR